MHIQTNTKVLNEFIIAAKTAYLSRTQDPYLIAALNKFFAAIEETALEAEVVSGRVSACQHMDEVLANCSFLDPDLQFLMRKFEEIEPWLKWRIRHGGNDAASDNFASNHANAIIIGPGGLKNPGSLQLGVTLLAPNVRYPDHRHSPEETYLVISSGDFRNELQEWVQVSEGGTFYNQHNITHAMRSSDIPLFAFWALLK